MKKIIQEIWKSEQKKMPCFDVIVYPDDTLTVLDFRVFYDPNTQKSTAEVTPLCDSDLASVLKYNPDCWVGVDKWTSLHHENRRYLGGEGSYGNEGFIACEDLEGNLIWAMFFENTNPFCELKIQDNWLIGISEHRDAQIEINLNNITEISFVFY